MSIHTITSRNTRVHNNELYSETMNDEYFTMTIEDVIEIMFGQGSTDITVTTTK